MVEEVYIDERMQDQFIKYLKGIDMKYYRPHGVCRWDGVHVDMVETESSKESFVSNQDYRDLASQFLRFAKAVAISSNCHLKEQAENVIWNLEQQGYNE